MFNLKTQVMKKLITIVAALLLSVNFLNAQTSDVYVIDQTTCDTIKSDAQTLYFDGGFTLNMAGRGRKAETWRAMCHHFGTGKLSGDH